jgi:hypothetical protein
MKVEMSGKEDRQGPWKFAIAGQPGSGKTMLSSTAPSPLFVFFQEQPRIKSVANRSIPHVKIVNDFTSNSYALDQMNALLIHLQLTDHDYETLIIDTGDEFFQQIKSGRTYQNGGEFAIGDWSWIADTYREVMLALIDLPMHVIVTFHVKGTSDEEPAKELMLQGQAKDEAAGWFDIVGALDTYEIVDEHGETVTKRVLLTANNRVYPWVKDHSGALPRRWELSEQIIDDIPKILELVSADTGTASREVIADIGTPEAPPAATNMDVPSPEELDAVKREAHVIPVLGGVQPEGTPHFDAEPLVSPVEELATSTLGEVPAETAPPIDTQDTQAPIPPVEEDSDDAVLAAEPANEVPLAPGSASVDRDPASVGSQAHVELAAVPPLDTEMDDAVETVIETLGAEEVSATAVVCEVCGVEVTDADLQELTQIRFQKWLCRPHFKEMLQQKK